MKVKKIPQRTCIGCQDRQGKRELLRIVRTPEGKVLLDLTGKKSGRGAYICRDTACLEKAMAGRRLEKALKATMTPEDTDALRQALLAVLEQKDG